MKPSGARQEGVSLLLAASALLVSCAPGWSADLAPDDGNGLGGAPTTSGGAESGRPTTSGGPNGSTGQYVPTGQNVVTSSGAGGDGGGGQGGIAADPPVLASTRQLCKLVNGVDQWDPTPNATHTRANVLGTDLGIPVAHGADLYLFFGDTVGYKGIWPFSESVPDAVGFASGGSAAVAADPASLCNGMRFLRRAPGASVGPTMDPAIEADFAGTAMIAPSGHALSEYIKNPAGPPGQNMFPDAPGSFEVPSGAFSNGGSIYVFYTTVQSPNDLTMKASYLAKWVAPSTTGLPTYQILHGVDERFAASGPLGGNFINIAAEPNGAYVYLFGTGQYRQSPIHLARKALASLDAPGGYEVFDAASGQWLPAPGASAAPIIAEATFGETSFRYFPEKGMWMFLAHGANRVVARFADRPEGPWSDAITVHDNTDPAFALKYCCVPENSCTGERLFNCSKASFYGTYLFPRAAVGGTGFDVTYTMSTWDPYNVALFTARFEND